MNKNKILILKNDRGGDLFTSLKTISTLMTKDNDVKIYLSELNFGFKFFFKNIKVSKFNYNLSLFNKITLFFDILFNKYDEIFILSPKSFYFYLPVFFYKVKFYAITYVNIKNMRPSSFLKKKLFKYKTIYRNKINYKSYSELQIDLLNNRKIDYAYNNLSIPIINNDLKLLLPEKFIFFQFRYSFFEQLGWGVDQFDKLIKSLLKKYDYVLFCSDLEKNKSSKYFNDYFEKNYSVIDSIFFKKIENDANKNIYFLKELNSENLFSIIKYSEKTLAKHGIFTHISFFHSTPCHSLFNFQINSKIDILNQKISYSEWYKNINCSFSFLNDDINKAIRKISKNI